MTGGWLVTGAGSGVGRAMACALARAGKPLVLTSRSLEGLQETKAACPVSASIELTVADLSEPSQTLRLSHFVRERFETLEGIVHCAGVFQPGAKPTSIGLDPHLAINYLAAFYLDELLVDLLIANGSSRVLLVAGASLTLRSIRPVPSYWFSQNKRGTLGSIGWSAAAKALHARSLHARYGRNGVAAFSLHPGLVRSKLARSAPWFVKVVAALAQPFFSRRCKTGEFLALSPDAGEFSGTFVESGKSKLSIPIPPDEAFETELWTWSRSVLGL